jgi:hypothetical protein
LCDEFNPEYKCPLRRSRDASRKANVYKDRIKNQKVTDRLPTKATIKEIKILLKTDQEHFKGPTCLDWPWKKPP